MDEAFNVGQTDDNYRIREGRDCGGSRAWMQDRICCRCERPDKRSYRVSIEKIRRKLPAFNLRWDAGRGAEQLYKAYQSSGLTLEERGAPIPAHRPHQEAVGRRSSSTQNSRHTQPLRSDRGSLGMAAKL
jgi:hypothetical protein